MTSSDCYLRGLRLTPAYRIMVRLAMGWNAPRQPVLGMVLSREVDSVRADVRTFEPGDRVFGFNRHRFGTYAQYVCWPEDGLLVQLSFGTWLFPLGYLVYKSRFLPWFLGVLLMLDGIGVLIWFLQALLLPAYPAIRYPGLAVTFIAEVGLALWLLLKSVKVIDYGPTQSWWLGSFPRRRSPVTSVNMTRWCRSTIIAACSDAARSAHVVDPPIDPFNG